MSAIFDFSSLVMVLLLMICTSTYLRELRPHIFDPVKTATADGSDASSSIMDSHGRIKREGLTGFMWKLSRIGERLSPYVGAGCASMAVYIIFLK